MTRFYRSRSSGTLSPCSAGYCKVSLTSWTCRYVFFALAKVAVYCLNGQLSDTKDPEWDRICHLDIKPDNIFLGAPNPNEPMEWARAYPVPKIGDWEIAYITTALYQGDPDDPLEWPRNPQDLQGTGTVGHMPPVSNHLFISSCWPPTPTTSRQLTSTGTPPP